MNPILVALDVPDAEAAVSLATQLTPYVGGFKVGLELLMGEGPDVIRRVGALGAPVFADAKLHDIPNTVRGAARQLARAGARWVTVHGGGGREMIEAAVAGLEGDGESGVLVVTVLTSLREAQLKETGIDRSLESQVVAITTLAAQAGAEGIVCSVLEVGVAREAAPSLKVVTPGIRSSDAAVDDQKRVGTLTEALDAGADMVVVGRAITAAADVVAAARALALEAGQSIPPPSERSGGFSPQ
ncbi:MAG: orotidine-5'-phosphate decarboxylase [Acidimicrobiia bacterium]